MTRPAVCFLFVIGLAAATARAAEPAPRSLGAPVQAVVESTLKTEPRLVRQLAFDGDEGTFFDSRAKASAGDEFRLVFDEPVALKRVAAITGKTGGGHALDEGVLEVSADGKTFEACAGFRDGKAESALDGREALAIRLRATRDLGHPLAVRELSVESTPPVARFRYPVEIEVDTSDAPEMRPWAEKVARTCERAYPMINEELKSEEYRPPRWITMTLKGDYRGVAMAGGDRITGSVRFFKEHPDDVGAMVHETTHVVQHYRGRNPSWLVEGVSDYVRFFKFEPGKLGPIDANRAHYNGSYRVTAAFLNYLAETYDPNIVRKLNALMRSNTYKETAFKKLTGTTLTELDEEWRASLADKTKTKPPGEKAATPAGRPPGSAVSS